MYYNSLFTINSLNIVLSYYPLKPLNNAYALKEELDRFVHRRESGWLKQPDLYENSGGLTRNSSRAHITLRNKL